MPAELAATAESAATMFPLLGQPPPALTVNTIGQAWRILVEIVGDEIEGRPRLWVLEAGAGPQTLFDLPEDAFIVGVDRDGEALASNPRLDERVTADISVYRPWAAGFDLVTCWYVLDRLPDPGSVLDRFAQWTAPHGLVVVAVPTLRSLRGAWARLRRRTLLRRALTPAALRRRFGAAGFVPTCQVYFEDADHAARRRQLGLVGGRWRTFRVLVRLCSGGLLDAARTDYIAVFRRTGP